MVGIGVIFPNMNYFLLGYEPPLPGLDHRLQPPYPLSLFLQSLSLSLYLFGRSPTHRFPGPTTVPVVGWPPSSLSLSVVMPSKGVWMFIPDKMIQSIVGRMLQVGWLRVKVVVGRVSGSRSLFICFSFSVFFKCIDLAFHCLWCYSFPLSLISPPYYFFIPSFRYTAVLWRCVFPPSQIIKIS